MELDKAGVEALEHAFAQSAVWIRTVMKHIRGIAGQGVVESSTITLASIAGALVLLDPSSRQKDFDEHVKEIREREARKATIGRLSL